MATQLAKRPRGYGDRLTPAEEAAIIASLRDGRTYKEIEAQFHVSAPTVARINKLRKVQEAVPVQVPRGPLTPYILGALAAKLIKTPYDRDEFQRGWRDTQEEAGE